MARTLHWADRLVILLAFGLLVLLCLRAVSSTDLGFHLRAGEYILEGHGWPRTDPFTYTVADHPYVDTSWGYQVVVTLVQRACDSPGLVFFHLILWVVTFYFVYRTAMVVEHPPDGLAVLLVIGVICCETRYETRPEVLSLCFLAVVLYLLTRHAEGLRTPLWLLPVIHLFWANCHAYFMLGWAAMFAFGVGSALSRGRVDTRLVAWVAVACAACFINPYGTNGVLFPLTLLTRFDASNVFSRSISEFASPFALRGSAQMPFFPRWPIYAFYLLSILSVFSCIAWFRQRRYVALLLWLMFGSLAATMMRNVPIFVVTLLPPIAWALSSGAPMRSTAPGRRPLRGLARLTLAAAGVLVAGMSLRVVTGAYYADDRRSQRFGLGWDASVLPFEAAAYARRVGLGGPVFNYLAFGGHLMWALRQPVYIDGRLEVIGEAHFREYAACLSNLESFAEASAKHGFTWAIFPYAHAPALLENLSRAPDWRLAYYDDFAVIFVKDGPDAARFIADSIHHAQAVHLDPSGIRSLPGLDRRPRLAGIRRWLAGFLKPRPFPRDALNRGLFHLLRGEWEAAASEFAMVIEQTDGAYAEVYFNLGEVLYRMDRLDDAARCFRVVLQDDPENVLAKARLGALLRTSHSVDGPP